MSATNTFSKLFRKLEAEIGTKDMALLVFDALVDSIQVFKAKTAHDFCSQFHELCDSVGNTEPKFGILNSNFAALNKKFEQTICDKNYSEKRWKNLAIAEVKKIVDARRDSKKLILENSEKINLEGKTILIHDHSHTVHDVLAHNKYLGRNFNVVIAEQNFDKTHDNIERMYGLGIPFKVVPAYMLSHVTDRISMAFFGAVTLKDTMTFVMDPGTHGVISELHIDRIPIYMFIDANKFSLWKSKRRGEIFIHEHKRMHHEKSIEYDRIKYSHDRVPAKLFTQIITNEGTYTPSELKKSFVKKMAEKAECPS